jgi:hypothetical protein
VIWMPASFRARITDPPTPAFDGDDCNPRGIPRPSDDELERADRADDYAEAYNDADTARIGAIFEKRTGRP